MTPTHLTSTDSTASVPSSAASASRLALAEISPTQWRVTIDNPPLNLFDPEMLAETRVLLDQMDQNRELKVVVFESANPEFFVAHIDLERWQEVPAGVPGAAPYSAWPAVVSRLAESPVISIASVRGRARGHGNEVALACDMRFASRERAVFSQLEVGLGVIPGGGGLEWLCALVGRSRALEIVTSSYDYDADTAERYGWINRALPDAELDEFVDTLAARLAGFDQSALALAKATVNSRAGIPAHGERMGSNIAFHEAAKHDGAAQAVGNAFGHGLQRPGDYELNLGDHLGQAAQTRA